jgi:pantetheine-phosphate adenylyltransferase
MIYSGAATTGVYAGSFDPVTLGHLDIIRRASRVFDHVLVLIAINPSKHNLFTPEEATQLLCQDIEDVGLGLNVAVDSTRGYVYEAIREMDLRRPVLVRGLRAGAEMEYEASVARYNKEIAGLETVLLLADPELTKVSSSMVKEMVETQDDSARLFVTPATFRALKRKLVER